MRVYSHVEIKAPIANVEKSKEEELSILTDTEILKKIDEIEANFIVARPQPDIGMAMGVCLDDIGESLGLTFGEIRRKFVRSRSKEILESHGYKIEKILRYSKCGKRSDSYVMEVDAARFLLAKDNSTAGNLYVYYLLNCRKRLENCTRSKKQDEESNRRKIEIFLMGQKRSLRRKKTKQTKNSHWHQQMQLSDSQKNFHADIDTFRHLCSTSEGNANSMMAILRRTDCDYSALTRAVYDFRQVVRKIKELTYVDPQPTQPQESKK